jgi:hypothetical protein
VRFPDLRELTLDDHPGAGGEVLAQRLLERRLGGILATLGPR